MVFILARELKRHQQHYIHHQRKTRRKSFLLHIWCQIVFYIYRNNADKSFPFHYVLIPIHPSTTPIINHCPLHAPPIKSTTTIKENTITGVSKVCNKTPCQPSDEIVKL